MQVIEIGSKTDRGKRRPRNEDAVLIRSKEHPSGEASPVYLLAVADRMGGVAGGHVASREAVRALGNTFRKGQESHPQGLLRDGFRGANARIRRLADQRPGLQGMCTTLVATIVSEGQAWVANVGDSRAYLIRNDQIRRLTEDHSWVAEQVKAGRMTEEEAATSPRRNIITRCLGSQETLNVDLLPPLSLQPDDVVVLCSDGLTGVVSEAEIATACTEYSPATVAEELVDLANGRGGPDNISVIVGRVHHTATETLTARSSAVARNGAPQAPAPALDVLNTGDRTFQCDLPPPSGDLDSDPQVGRARPVCFSFGGAQASAPSLPTMAATIQLTGAMPGTAELRFENVAFFTPDATPISVAPRPAIILVE